MIPLRSRDDPPPPPISRRASPAFLPAVRPLIPRNRAALTAAASGEALSAVTTRLARRSSAIERAGAAQSAVVMVYRGRQSNFACGKRVPKSEKA